MAAIPMAHNTYFHFPIVFLDHKKNNYRKFHSQFDVLAPCVIVMTNQCFSTGIFPNVLMTIVFFFNIIWRSEVLTWRFLKLIFKTQMATCNTALLSKSPETLAFQQFIGQKFVNLRWGISVCIQNKSVRRALSSSCSQWHHGGTGCDSVDDYRLLAILHSGKRKDGAVQIWFESYLKGRAQYIAR